MLAPPHTQKNVYLEKKIKLKYASLNLIAKYKFKTYHIQEKEVNE